MMNPQIQRAASLLSRGRYAEAVEIYNRILVDEPRMADAWFNLAYAQKRLGAYEEALCSYQSAIDHGVRSPEEARVNRAAILSDHLARTDLAIAELEAAMTIRPGYFPALFNLANLHEDLGLVERARILYRSAQEVAPDNAMVLARLAMLDVHTGVAQHAVDDLTKALRAKSWSAVEEADLRYALARALDALADTSGTFSSLERANMLSKRLAHEQGFIYNRVRHEALVDKIIATFPLDVALKSPLEGRSPLFICGLFRSGSTLTEQILANHSLVMSGGELEFIPRLVAEDLHPYPDFLRSAGFQCLQQTRASYLERASKLFPGDKIITDKRPDNFLHIGLIKSIFPESRVIHTFRADADNILSIYFLNFQHAVSYGFDLTDIAHWMRQKRRLMSHWQSFYGGDIFNLDYDVLVRDAEGSTRSLLSFCDLPFEDACLRPHESGAVVRTASALQVREPLHQKASGRAERYRHFLAEALDLLNAD